MRMKRLFALLILGTTFGAFGMEEVLTKGADRTILLSDELQERMEKSASELKYKIAQKVALGHKLFYGPSVSSKRVYAKILASKSGMQYVRIEEN